MNFRAREYNGRYFNSISAWRLSASEWGSNEESTQEAKDDLPF
jgi:hypothetical protein